MKKCVIVGAGGHGMVVADAASAAGFNVIGFIDNHLKPDDISADYPPLLGSDEQLVTLSTDAEQGFVCGVGGTGDNTPRTEVFERAIRAGLTPVTVIHPRAIVADNCRIGEGSVICVGALINIGVEIGTNVIVNSGAIVEHHCRVGDHAHISSGSVLCGNVDIGIGAHVGAGATIRQGVRVGRKAVVGAGAIVVTDVGDNETVVSERAKPLAEPLP